MISPYPSSGAAALPGTSPPSSTCRPSHGWLHGVLERVEVAHQVGVGDRYVVPDVDQQRVAVGGGPGGADLEDVRHGRESLAERRDLGGVGGAAVGVVDDDLGGCVAGLGEVFPELVHAHLGAGVGDVVVVLGVATERAGQGEDGERGDEPGEEGPPRVGRGSAAEAVEEAGHGWVLRECRCGGNTVSEPS